MQDNDETSELAQSPELLRSKPKVEQSSEKGQVMVAEAMKDIKDTERFVEHTTSAGGAELTAATDDALVFVADQTITSADQDGVHSATEQIDIKKSLQAVVVEGAMVESGNKQTTADNPIVSLDKAGRDKEVTAMIKELEAEDAKLPTGEDIALMAELARINHAGGAGVETGGESDVEHQVDPEHRDEDSEDESEAEPEDNETDTESAETDDETEATSEPEPTDDVEGSHDATGDEKSESDDNPDDDDSADDEKSEADQTSSKPDPFDRLEDWSATK